MKDFKKLFNSFQSFLQTIDIEKLSKPEIKLINIIKDNFANIAIVGTAAGKRAKLLNELFTKKWLLTIDELAKIEEINPHNLFPVKKLNAIEINNFRGFTDKFSYEFKKPYTLIYGTNGSGKTSFCEALEYALLGYISEAEAKRIDTSKYITNLVTGKSSPPILRIINSEDKEVNAIPSPNTYHFCFIEKNRIDGFSRISANTPANQSQLLSTLFGLEDFNEFVSEFTDNIEKYIVIEGEKAKQLIIKKREMENHNVNLKASEQNILNLSSEKHVVVKESLFPKTFSEIDLYINGNDGVIGRLDIIDGEIQSINTTLYETDTIAILTKALDDLNSSLQVYKQLNQQFEISKEQINYRKLFTAVKELEQLTLDKCPACHTPIEHVTKNPFDNAREKLVDLEKLAVLEVNIESETNKIVESSKNLIKDIEKKNKFALELGSTFKFTFPSDLIVISRINLKDTVSIIEKFISDIRRNMEPLNILDKLLNLKNEESNKSSQSKKTLFEEKLRLQKISDKIKDINSRENVYKQLISQTKESIKNFTTINQPLINEVEEEKKQILINTEIVNAYRTLLNKMKKYNEDLPVTLVSNLNELTRDFYNEINKHDSAFELLEKIELPSNPQDKIFAYFKDNPTKKIEALHVLSEGHVRCLGLSILLAKIVKDNINIIIFDDVVNAIDDDHRGGIRELLLGNEKINTKQIILTSHAEEFIKDLENQVTKKDYENFVSRISFLPSENRTINVDLMSTANYLKNAQNYLDKSLKRECLRNCRSALENINSVLWKRLAKKYNTPITVQIRVPKGMPDSMSTVNGLSQFLRKTVNENKYDKILEIYDYLAGLKTKNNSVWNYLNKGTHEEEDVQEFDMTIVREIFSKLVTLDTEAKAV